MAVGSVGSCAKLFQNGFLGDTRPDVIEIFGGHAEVSLQFARKGWSVSQPIDEIYGCDLKDSAERQKVLDLVRSQRPRLLIISWPCEYWGKLTDANFRSKQERRRLMQKREQERPLLQFTEELFDIQIGHGDDALAETLWPRRRPYRGFSDIRMCRWECRTVVSLTFEVLKLVCD